MSREEIREYLNAVYDLERLLGKVSYKTANPRDLIAFRNSMQMLPPIKSVLEDFHSEELVKIENDIDALQDLCTLIEEAIVEEPPISIREGGMIKEGFDETIDQLRAAKTEGKTWLAELEEQERDWNMINSAACGSRLPHRSNGSSARQRQLPAWMSLPPLHLLRSEITMSARS